jgi:cyanophycinase
VKKTALIWKFVLMKRSVSCLLAVPCLSLLPGLTFLQTANAQDGSQTATLPAVNVLPATVQPVTTRPAEAVTGSLVICGGGSTPDDVMARFVELAGGNKARIVVIPTASESALNYDVDNRLETFKDEKVAGVTLLHAISRDAANDPDLAKPLAEATGVWFTGGRQYRVADTYLDTTVDKMVHAVLARGGVVGGTSSGAAIMSSIMIRRGFPQVETGKGFNFLPGTVIDQHFTQRKRQPRLMDVLTKNPGLFGLGIDENTAVVVQGRRLEVFGECEVSACLPAAGDRPAKIETLKPGDVADLVAWSRAAIARVTQRHPAAETNKPEVPRGTLVIVGGGATPPEATRRFIEAAGGPEAPLVVVTTAIGDDPPSEEQATGWLKKAGAKDVRQIHACSQIEAGEKNLLDSLRRARGVWFSGGRQWRLVEAYLDTEAHQLFQAVLDKGGVIGGTSAGATVQASYLVRGNPLGNSEMMTEGYERGFGFLPGVAIDQHFSQRKRYRDMQALKRAYPQLIGLGVDESTAAIIKGHEMEVVGKHQVAVYDHRNPEAKREREYEVLQAGARYDLQDCKVLPQESKVIQASATVVESSPPQVGINADPADVDDSITSLCQ